MVHSFYLTILLQCCLQIPTLAKAICRAGILGSSALPASAGASVVTKDGASFTVISNAGATALGSAKET